MHARSRWLGCCLLLALVVGFYYPALHHSFLNYDDDDYVVANPNVHAGFTAASLKWALTNIDAAQWTPVTWMSHMLDYKLYGLNPAGHHLTNIALHAANACALFLVLCWITGATGRSLVVAALFAVHSVNVENVAWVAERKTLLCALFSLATIAAYAWYSRRPNGKRYGLTVIAFALALGSKSMAVTIPVVLLMLDFWPLGNWREHRVSKRRLIAEKLPLLAMALAVSLLTVHAEDRGAAITHSPLSMRAAHAVWSCVAYIWKLIWPMDLTVLVPFPLHGHPWWAVAGSAILLISITATVLVAWKSRPYLAIGWLIYLVSIVPVSGIIPVGHSALSDRFLYTPEIGVFLLAVWGIADLLERAHIRGPVAGLLGLAAVAAYGSGTATYLPAWKNSLTLFSRAERLSPAPDSLIENNLGQGLSELGRAQEALPHYRLAAALAPDQPLPHYNLGNSLLAAGDAQGAATEFEIALRDSPTKRVQLPALNNLGVALLRMNQPQLAEENFTAALTIAPQSERPLVGRGQARLELGRFRDAESDLERAVQLANDPSAYFLLGKTLAAEEQREAAIAALQKSLQLAPEFPEAQKELEKLNSKSER